MKSHLWEKPGASRKRKPARHLLERQATPSRQCWMKLVYRGPDAFLQMYSIYGHPAIELNLSAAQSRKVLKVIQLW